MSDSQRQSPGKVPSTRSRFLRAAAGASTVAATTPALFLRSTARARAAEWQVRIGYQALWATAGNVYETLRHTNIFERNGISAEFKTFTYGGPLGEAAVAGYIDNVIAADVPVIRAVERAKGWKVTNRLQDSRFAVMVAPDFKGSSLNDLIGKTVAAPFGTNVFPATVLHMISIHIPNPLQEIRFINQDIAEQAVALQAKQVDAVISWDPTEAELERKNLARILWPSANFGWQGFSPKVLENTGLMVALMKSFAEAVWWTSNHVQQARDWFGKTSRIGAYALEKSDSADRFQKVPIKDLREIDLAIPEAEIRKSQLIMDFLLERGLLSEKANVTQDVDMAFWKEAKAQIDARKHLKLADIKIVTP